jgi:hypothetical protein
MTAMDAQSARDARGAGSGGNAVGLHGATLAHCEVTLEVIVASIVMDPGSEAGMTESRGRVDEMDGGDLT